MVLIDVQEYARDVVKESKTDEAKSFGEVLLGNTYFLSAPNERAGQKLKDTAAIQNRFHVWLQWDGSMFPDHSCAAHHLLCQAYTIWNFGCQCLSLTGDSSGSCKHMDMRTVSQDLCIYFVWHMCFVFPHPMRYLEILLNFVHAAPDCSSEAFFNCAHIAEGQHLCC